MTWRTRTPVACHTAVAVAPAVPVMPISPTPLGTLLRRTVETGAMRRNIGPEDLLRALMGMGYAQDRPGWQATWRR